MYKILKESYGKVNGINMRLRVGQVVNLDEHTAAKLVAIGNAVKHKPHPKIEPLETKPVGGLINKLKGFLNERK